MAVNFLKIVILYYLIQSTLEVCRSNSRVELTCVNERLFNQQWPSVTTLRLIESYIDKARLKTRFPKIDKVFIVGSNRQLQCAELANIGINLQNCEGKLTCLIID